MTAGKVEMKKTCSVFLRGACAAILGLGCMAGAQTARAGEVGPVGREPYLNLAGGHTWLDDAWGAPDAGYGLQFLLGWSLSPAWRMEVSSSYFNLETGEGWGTDFYRTSLGMDVLWTPFQGKWTPFLLAGAGAAYNDIYPENDDIDPFANVGVGVMFPPLGRYGVRFRVEGRYTYQRHRPSSTTDRYAFLGVSIPLRPAPRFDVKEVEVHEVVREVVREVIVPAPALPPPPPPQKDSDNDGVDDGRDRCPNTLPGTQVDREGCAIEHSVVTLQGVHFETGSARLTRDSLAILAQASAALNGQPSMRIEVRGHTDSAGSDAANQSLSERRAQSVVDFMVQSGISRSRLEALGFGETLPVADNATAEGRASNRRVEFRVLSR
jgi:OOP family OmpA-OmpF porin